MTIQCVLIFNEDSSFRQNYDDVDPMIERILWNDKELINNCFHGNANSKHSLRLWLCLLISEPWALS